MRTILQLFHLHIWLPDGTAKFLVDVKEEGGGGSDLNVQWMLSGAIGNMSTAPNK